MAFLGRLLRGSPSVPLAAGEIPPKKVAWLNPWVLLQTGYHAWLVTAGSGILDRREVLAALNQFPRGGDPAFLPPVVGSGAHIDGYVPDTYRGQLGLDFMADVGDSWEATYSVASLLVEKDLRRRLPPTRGVQSASASRVDPFATKLGPGEVLILGGDLVYPRASRDAYRRRFCAPFQDAFPKPSDDQWRCMFALPGNHDWYDGLTSFVRRFCQGGSIGGWRLSQRRSYFAVKLTHGWWLWGIDIALDTSIDSPQQKYFTDILSGEVSTASESSEPWPPAQRFGATDRIILCTAKPAWLEISRYSDDSYENLALFIANMEKARNAQHPTPQEPLFPLILTGDMHHYCRYGDETRQLIVAGGGGAYLVGTHFLPQSVPKLELPPEGQHGRPSSSTHDRFRASLVTYPERAESRMLALGALLLPFRTANWPFCIVAAAVYWFVTLQVRMAWLVHQDPLGDPEAGCASSFLALPLCLWTRPDRYTLTFALIAGVVLACVLVSVFMNDRAAPALTSIWGAVHGGAHIWVAFAAAGLVAPTRASVDRFDMASLLYVVTICKMAVVGGLAAGLLVGVYLVVSDRYFDLHHNEVFAVQSLIDYRNFLRMIIQEDGKLVVIPIGLRRVPRRWRRRMDPDPKGDTRYEPGDELLKPHIIEGPLVFDPNSEPPRWI